MIRLIHIFVLFISIECYAQSEITFKKLKGYFTIRYTFKKVIDSNYVYLPTIIFQNDKSAPVYLLTENIYETYQYINFLPENTKKQLFKKKYLNYDEYKYYDKYKQNLNRMLIHLDSNEVISFDFENEIGVCLSKHFYHVDTNDSFLIIQFKFKGTVIIFKDTDLKFVKSPLEIKKYNSEIYNYNDSINPNSFAFLVSAVSIKKSNQINLNKKGFKKSAIKKICNIEGW